MAAKYTSLKVVIDKLLRDPLFNGLNFEAAVDYCVEFLYIVGVPDLFEEQLLNIEVEEYRALLPSNFVSEIEVLINGHPARTATDTYHQFYDQLKTVSNSHVGYSDGEPKLRRSADYTFQIKGDVIYTSVKKANLKMTYWAVPVDDEGYPLIPENPTCMRAIKNYIELQHIRILWRSGKVTDKVYQDAQQQYSWAVGAYETDSRKLSLPDAESFYNMYKTLLIRDNEYNNRFRNLGTKEYIRRH